MAIRLEAIASRNKDATSRCSVKQKEMHWHIMHLSHGSGCCMALTYMGSPSSMRKRSWGHKDPDPPKIYLDLWAKLNNKPSGPKRMHKDAARPFAICFLHHISPRLLACRLIWMSLTPLQNALLERNKLKNSFTEKEFVPNNYYACCYTLSACQGKNCCLTVPSVNQNCKPSRVW